MEKQIRVKNQFGREIVVKESQWERNKESWTIIDEVRDKDNNIDTTLDRVVETEEGVREEIDLPDFGVIKDELDKMGIAELRAECKRLGLTQPFGASKDALRELIINSQ